MLDQDIQAFFCLPAWIQTDAQHRMGIGQQRCNEEPENSLVLVDTEQLAGVVQLGVA